MVECKLAEFKMAAIMKLSQNEWVKVFFVQNGWIKDGRFQDSCNHPVESEWMSEVFCANGGNQSWQVWVSLRGKTKMAESKMVKFKLSEIKMAAIIKLNENEWVWVRLNLFESKSEWSKSGFEWIWKKIPRCLNPRWKCLNPTWQNSRWLSSSSWVRMNEWNFYSCKMAESKMAEIKMEEFKMDPTIKLSQKKMSEFHFVQNGWIH